MYLGESYCDVRKYGGILHVFKKSEKLWVHRIGNAWRMPFDDECKVLSLDKSLEIGSKGYFQINDLYIYVLKRKTNGALGICSIHLSMSKSLNVTWRRVLMLKNTGYYVCQEDDVVVSCIMRGAWSGLREWKKSMEGMCTRFAEWGYARKVDGEFDRGSPDMKTGMDWTTCCCYEMNLFYRVWFGCCYRYIQFYHAEVEEIEDYETRC